MKKTGPLVLMALLGGLTVQGVEYAQHEKEGHCPFDAGVIVSNVKDTLNPHRLTGRWMNIFDRHAMNNDHKCYGVKLMHTYAYDDGDESVKDEAKMKDVERVFEYIKATNVGESQDPTPPAPKGEDLDDEEEEKPAYEDHEVDLLSFGYHVYNGFQLHFKHKDDKSVAQFVHRDVNLKDHKDEDVKEHEHSGEKEPYFNEHVFDSQFKRYAQVLDTDYDNYAVIYQCFETAQYFDKETGVRIPNYEAWEMATSSSLNFSEVPQSNYIFGDKVEVHPRHFENVKILWRPKAEKQEYIEPENLEGSGLTQKDINENREQMPTEYRYPPAHEDGGKIEKRVGEIKEMIKAKIPNLDMSQYDLLDHVSGRCDYDPYDRYDAEWHDEGSNFGHMFSEAVPPTMGVEALEELEAGEDQEEAQDEHYGDDNQEYENPDDLPDQPHPAEEEQDDGLGTSNYEDEEPDIHEDGHTTDFESEEGDL